MRRESHVRICERLGVKFPGPTRHDFINNVGSQDRVDFGGANQLKGSEKGAEHADYRL